MAGTLEKLLSIQGAEEQLSLDTLSGAQNGPQEREEGPGRILPASHPIGLSAGHTEPNRAKQGTGSPPDMLEAWREAYRIFSRYAPALKAAAAEDGEYNEAAGRAFNEASQRVARMAAAGGDAQIVALRVYDMLDDVWRAARNHGGPLQAGRM